MDDFTGADISSAMTSASSDAPPAAPESVSPPSEPTAQPGAATTQPAVQAPTKPQGPIPFDVHTRSMENARAKAIEEYKAKYGWAETIPQTELNQALALAKRASSDPIAYVRELIAELQQHPQHGPALRSEAARALAAGRGQPSMPEPDITVTDEHGNVVGQTYSAAAQAKRDAWLKDQWLTEVRQEIAPLVKTHQTLETERQKAHDEAEGQKFATTLYGELKDYPHFEANKKAIGAEVVNLLQQYGDDPRTNDPAFLEAVTLRAYHRVVTTKQDALSRQAAVHDQTTKATVSGVVPGRAPVGAPKSNANGTFSGADLAAEFAKRRMG